LLFNLILIFEVQIYNLLHMQLCYNVNNLNKVVTF